MTVPAGKVRVVLVGGDRHGQWHDVPDHLPDDVLVRHRPRRLAYHQPADGDIAAFMPEVPFDLYYRKPVVGLSMGGVTSMTVYITGRVYGDEAALSSAVHLAWCQHDPYCQRTDLHDWNAT